MGEKTQIFLSYGRKDDDELYPIVEKVARHLNALPNFKAWYDKIDMISTLEFTDEIAKAIEASGYLVFFIGDHSLNSEYCQREWMHAIKHCVPIIPVLVNGTWEDPRIQALPRQINRKNGLDMTKLSESDFLSELVRLLSVAPPPLIQPKGAKKPPSYVIHRPQYTSRIKEALGIGDPTSPHRTNMASITSEQEVEALMGIGGIGKTTLALLICNDCDVRRTFDHIFWLDVNPGDREQKLIALFKTLGAYLGEPIDSDSYKDWRIARALVQMRLANKRVLIVLDDVWQDELIPQFNFAGVDCRLLVTTRNKALVDNPQAVGRLSEQEGLELLARMADPLKPNPDALTRAHRDIIHYLDGYTLAIEIAARWLKKHSQKTPEEYLALLKSDTASLFDNLQVGKDKNANLEKSLALSYQFLEDDVDRARFRALGIFAPNASYAQVALDAVWGINDAFKEATALVEVGLLDYDPTTKRYSQHPLLRAYAQKLLRDAGEYDAVFDAYAAYYIKRAREIFKDTPLEKWDDNVEDSPNAHDIINIKALGEAIATHTQHGTTGDLRRALDFAIATTRYVNYRMEAKAWAWLEMGIAAARGILSITPTDADVQSWLAVILNNIGLVYDALGDKQKALACYEEALPIRRAVGDKSGEAAALTNIGMVYYATGEMQKALAYLQEALPIYRAVGDKSGEAGTLNNIGLVYYATSEMQKALAYFEQALPIYRAVGDKSGEATTLNNIGGVYLATGEMQKALAYFEAALPIHRAVGDKSGEATTLNNIGMVYYATGEMQKALACYEQALPIHRAVGHKSGEAAALTNIGMVYSALGDKQKALACYEQALPIVRAVGDKSGEAGTLTNIGMVYSATGEMQKALAYYEEALPIVRAVGDKSGEATTLNNIGMVYYATGEMQKALAYYEQALPIYRAVGHKSGEATTLTNIGRVYDDWGDKQKALAYYEQALPIQRAVGHKSGEATALNNIGRVYDALGDKQKALTYFEEALGIFITIGALPYVVAQQVNIAVLLDEMGRLDEAIDRAQQAVRLMREKGLSHDGAGRTLADVEEILHDLKRKRGDAI
jgi:tetratricopeptide (TPR) repeat protein